MNDDYNGNFNHNNDGNNKIMVYNNNDKLMKSFINFFILTNFTLWCYLVLVKFN